jgi:hypothetical protein
MLEDRKFIDLTLFFFCMNMTDYSVNAVLTDLCR